MLKKIFFGAVAIVVLLVVAVAIVSFATATDFKVEREITINRPRAEIYSYARFLRNQNDWGPWFKREPTMQQEFRGTDGTVGFVSAWKGQKEETGEGEQEIMELVENERIRTEIRFKVPFESTGNALLYFEPAGEAATKVRWTFSGSAPRPLNVMFLFIDMDKELGKDLIEGLAGLRSIMEKN